MVLSFERHKAASLRFARQAPMTAPCILSNALDKRRRRTRAEIERMRETTLGILESHHPQSVRHIFYRMTDPRLDCAVEKSESGYRHVQYQLSEMRKRGILPYGWIVDATRRGYFVTTFASASDFVRRMAGLYGADAWRDAEAYVEVWCESRSIAAVVQDNCEELGVSLYPSGGFASLTLRLRPPSRSPPKSKARLSRSRSSTSATTTRRAC